MRISEKAMTTGKNNAVWQKPAITKGIRERLNGHRGVVIWFTGLPCSGKSTIANALEEKLFLAGCRTYVLDGDNVRHGLCSDLGFSKEDRMENIRRIGEVAKLFIDAGIITLTAFVSPFRSDRERVRRLVGEGYFIEIYCRCPVEVCEQRDVKGHYRRARAGEIREFTGITSPYEEPENVDLILCTHEISAAECSDRVLSFLLQKGIVSAT